MTKKGDSGSTETVSHPAMSTQRYQEIEDACFEIGCTLNVLIDIFLADGDCQNEDAAGVLMRVRTAFGTVRQAVEGGEIGPWPPCCHQG